MSTKSSFEDLFRQAEASPDYWKRGANLGFVYGIDRLLKLAGKSRAYLAEKAGMEESTLSRALSGKQNLTIATMDRLASALGAALHIHVEKREVRGGWVPIEEMRSVGEPGTTTPRLEARFEGVAWSAPGQLPGFITKGQGSG